jgi:NADPH:quinone reductase-like Zn-dependent oxidoreductase
MKAVRIHDYGDASKLVFEDAPKPSPAKGEMLVKVQAAGVNPVDWKIRAGMFRGGLDFTMPATLGFDIAGEVAEVGEGVKKFEKGDKVFAYLALNRGGGYAEYAIVKENEAAAMPKELDFVKAAATPLTALTAWQCLFDVAKLDKGQTVASAANIEFVKSLGADEVVDYKSVRFEDVVKDVDVVLDTVGDDTTNRSAAVLKKGGILVSIAGDPDPAKFAERGVRVATHLVEPSGEQLARIAKLIESGGVKPHVSQELPLKDAAKAHQQSESGRTRGKIVLVVG